jgi:ABC-type multidrug transport system permease subunit
LQLAKILPTYYLAEGVLNATQNLGSWSSNLLDIGVLLVSTVVLLAISTWALRRQSAVLAII